MKIINIIGGGISGCILAWKFDKMNFNVKIWNHPNFETSSKAGAGIINPITGQRWVLDSHFVEKQTVADHFYHEINSFFDQNIFNKTKILKLFKSNDDKLIFEKRLSQLEYQQFLKPNFEKFDFINPEFDFGWINDVGYLNMSNFIEVILNYFNNKNALKNEIYVNNNQEITIYCDGFWAQSNDLIPSNCFNFAKGEVLILHWEKPKIDFIINKGVFILPIGNDLYKIGSTYDRENLNFVPNENSKNDLISQFKEIANWNYSIVNQQVGIRSISKDRNPIIGKISENIYIFNGFGSKVCLWAPYYSEIFLNYLINNQNLSKEIDVNRF